MNSTSITYHLSKSALMARQGAGTGVSAGAAVSESDMVYGVGCVCVPALCVPVVAYAEEKERMEG